MDTKSLIKWGLIAGAAYLLYTYLRDQGYLAQLGIAPSTGAGATLPAAATTTHPALALPAPAATTAPAASQMPVATAPAAGSTHIEPSSSYSVVETPPAAVPLNTNTIEQVRALAAHDANLQNGMMEFERWNVYYHQTPEGQVKPAPDPGSAGIDPNARITVEQWFAAVHALGISGLVAADRQSIWGWKSNPWMA